jgi:hypothetical protein
MTGDWFDSSTVIMGSFAQAGAAGWWYDVVNLRSPIWSLKTPMISRPRRQFRRSPCER